jgi:hypothetical protein
MVSQRFGVPMETAFGSLRHQARQHSQRLEDLCRSIVNRELEIDVIHIEFAAISPPRRQHLRARAIERWRQTAADSQVQRERAMAAVSRSVEARVRLEHDRAVREAEAIGRAIDRHFREVNAVTTGGTQPRVLVRIPLETLRTFVLDTLRQEARLIVHDESVFADALGVSITDQPDLVILGPEMLSLIGDDFISRLHQYCPDSRTLIIFETEVDGETAARMPGVDRVVRSGDAQALRREVLELCGARRRRQPA